MLRVGWDGSQSTTQQSSLSSHPYGHEGRIQRQAVPITVYALGRAEHICLVLFEEAARAAIPMIMKGDVNAHECSYIVYAFGKIALFEVVATAAIPISQRPGHVQHSVCSWWH